MSKAPIAAQEAGRIGVVILGAGLAGLCAAHGLGRGYRLVERESRPGGLVRTEKQDGFHFDATGHWLHLRNPVTKKLVEKILPGRMDTCQRRAAIHSQGVFTPYPFQANLFGLPRETVAECLLGFINARMRPPARRSDTFEGWINDTFGAGIARHFMLPYNRKLWTLDPKKLSSGFCEKYIPVPKIEDIVRGSIGLSPEAMGYNANFLYPSDGRIESLPEALSAGLKIAPETGKSPVSIDLHRKIVRFDDGSATRYAAMISPIPLPDLVKLLLDAPASVTDAAGRLKATTVSWYNIAAVAHGPQKHSWVYFPEDPFEFYRIGSYSACHAGTAPEGMASFYVEYSHLKGKDRDDGTLQRCLDQMTACGLLRSRDDVLFTQKRSIWPAYVLYDEHYDRSMKLIRDFMRRNNIILAGRYGAWGYSAMEDAMLEGLAAAVEARKLSAAG